MKKIKRKVVADKLNDDDYLDGMISFGIILLFATILMVFIVILLGIDVKNK